MELQFHKNIYLIIYHQPWFVTQQKQKKKQSAIRNPPTWGCKSDSLLLQLHAINIKDVPFIRSWKKKKIPETENEKEKNPEGVLFITSAKHAEKALLAKVLPKERSDLDLESATMVLPLCWERNQRLRMQIWVLPFDPFWKDSDQTWFPSMEKCSQILVLEFWVIWFIFLSNACCSFSLLFNVCSLYLQWV